MILKNNNQKLEQKQKKTIVELTAFVPKVLLREMESFKKRNGISVISNGKNMEAHCDQCFKAFSLSKAKELKLGEETVSFLDGLYDCEIGHNGYYKDVEKIIKI